MKKLLLCIAVLLNMSVLSAQTHQDIQRPKLVVGIVVDQMRWDYLYKYYDRYSEYGFKRLMNEGYNCQNTLIDYLPTFTGPGHTAAYTGSVPAIHGIAANDWIDRESGETVYCVEDKTVLPVGGSRKAGMMSPRNLFTTTVTDELRIATHKRAKVFGVGLKDRGSILPAGHVANGAFWFDDSTGNFITSSYYMNELPEWLVKFNDKRWADTIIKTVWEPLYPLTTYINSTMDNTPFEGKLPGEEKAPVFPHKPKSKNYYGLRYMPGGNTITLKAARACIKGEELGKDDVTDFLCITMSTTDYAGHNYGPDALEMEDMYLRLDMELVRFLSYLDKKVGKGNYTVFLTADHGAAHNAGYMRSLNVPAGSKIMAKAVEELNAYIKKQTGKDSLLTALYNYQVNLNEHRIKDLHINRGELKELIMRWLREQDGVANVIDMENISSAVIPERILNMVVNGYNRERSGVIQIIMKPGWYSGYGNTGTTHGSWNAYDSHIPLLWYGWGIPHGATYRTVHMTDIAPTVAALLHIQMPNGCIGNVISEVMKK